MNFRTNQHDYFRRPLTIRHEHRNFCILYLSELGRHQLVKLGIARELVDKRHKRAADLEKPLSCADIRDIAELKVGDIKELGKLNTVCGRLIEHNDKFAVGKHCSCRVALQKVVHILRDACAVRTVLSYSFPERKEEVCGVFVLKEQINLINENESVSAFGSVLGNTV